MNMTRRFKLSSVVASGALVLVTTFVGTNSGTAATNYDAMLKASRAMVPATFQGPTTPAKAPKGIKIAAITCYSILEGCVIPADGIAKAAKAIGWTSRTFDGGGTPTSQNTQILNAVSWGAKVIALIAISPSAVQTGLAAAKKAGAIIVSGSSGLSSPNAPVPHAAGIIWPAFDVSPDYKSLGAHLAQWIIADSKGTANVGVYGDKEFDSINGQEKGIVPALKACTTCTSSSVMYFTASQIGSTLGSQISGFVRSNPNVNYLYVPYDPPAAATVQALQTANLGTQVKIVSALGNAQNLQFVKNGQVQAADAAYDNIYMGFAIVDQSIRVLTHKPLIKPYGEGLPFQVLDATNLPKYTHSWTAPYSYESKFIALWK